MKLIKKPLDPEELKEWGRPFGRPINDDLPDENEDEIMWIYERRKNDNSERTGNRRRD